MGPAMLGILPGIEGIGGNTDMFDIFGIGGNGVPPADGGNCPPAGDLTADTNAFMETGDTCDTPKFGGGWLIKADDKLNFGKLELVCGKQSETTDYYLENKFECAYAH